ncbi:MAG: phosphate ABC transporter ATP-binding protein [Calditrichaceae bacterium]|nr:phosphate ABC transporter ATP-binding protein [Calditrichaceae bacterium]MBN2710042.1 phosphate ABC transporter ATP-binding protein [Calditrichaceae bacterium]RQV92141.1 MAG: phosphate ABC transporter ATP-binding protein [Calditrichota bacterium]
MEIIPVTEKNSLEQDNRSVKRNEVVRTENLDFFYNPESHALKNINLSIPGKKVTAFIGPSGCGKSTLLRCFNRMNDLLPGSYLKGRVLIDNKDIYANGIRLEELRKKVGMVFQKSNPFPMSIWENVAFGPRVNGESDKHTIEEVVKSALEQADLWKETKDRLNESALDLSGGQQQRLCIARTLANKPEIILMDEPASALDPISTGKIEETIIELKKNYTIIIVTHNMQQAARISDFTAFMMLGEMIEFNDTKTLFTNPNENLTEEYITGRFG